MRRTRMSRSVPARRSAQPQLERLEDRTVLSFLPAVNYRVGSPPSRPYWTETSDLDRDGDLDLVAANFLDGTVSVLLNVGNGEFAKATDYFAGAGPTCVAAADFDRDGWPDL